jgi:hypothetical protein
VSPFFNASENQILNALLVQDVRFVVVGGAAVQHHGVSRPRNDLDILLEPTPENPARFAAALQSCGLTVTAERQERIGQPEPPLQIRLDSPYDIDVLTSIFGVTVADALSAAVLVHSNGGAVPVLSRTHLIASKRARGEEKDLADLAELESGAITGGCG